MELTLPSFSLEWDGNPDGQVLLTQDFGGNGQCVSLHRSQVALIAERLGLLPVAKHDDPDRTIARLSRQLRILYDRINQLDDWLHNCSDHAHADLDHECTFSMATWELAHEFVADLPPLVAANVAASDTEEITGALPGKNGAALPESAPKTEAAQGLLDLTTAPAGPTAQQCSGAAPAPSAQNPAPAEVDA